MDLRNKNQIRKSTTAIRLVIYVSNKMEQVAWFFSSRLVNWSYNFRVKSLRLDSVPSSQSYITTMCFIALTILYVPCVLVIKVWIAFSFNNRHESHGLACEVAHLMMSCRWQTV